MPEKEDFIPAEARIEEINKLELSPSWAKGAKVTISVEKKGDRWEVSANMDPKPTGTPDWLDIAPTTLEFDDADAAVKRAESLRDNVESWPESNL